MRGFLFRSVTVDDSSGEGEEKGRREGRTPRLRLGRYRMRRR